MPVLEGAAIPSAGRPGSPRSPARLVIRVGLHVAQGATFVLAPLPVALLLAGLSLAVPPHLRLLGLLCGLSLVLLDFSLRLWAFSSAFLFSPPLEAPAASFIPPLISEYKLSPPSNNIPVYRPVRFSRGR